MPGLNHQIIYIENEESLDEDWKNIKYNPLSINGINILEENYFEIYDDTLRWFIDIFNWGEMYNPAKKELTNGFCYYGKTIIKKHNMDKLDKIINALIDLFQNAPLEIILTGNYCINDECYEKVKIDKNKIMDKLIKFKKLIEKVINNGGYLLHCGI